MRPIVVSVVCKTFNHKNYIAQCLDGFLSQKTNFRIEVIVHDDASTDGTTDIVKQYAEQYPDIIIPIIQKENQYSKHVKVNDTFIAPLIRGKYIAMCEGDDYWCCDTKLQQQVEFLESHSEYSACVHCTKVVDVKGNVISLTGNLDDECDLYFSDVVLQGGSEFHTSSILCRKEYFFHRPVEFSSVARVGDYPFAIYLASKGKIRRLGDVMSVYRIGTYGSWSGTMSQDKMIQTYYALIEFLEKIDDYFDNKYHAEICRAVRFHRFKIDSLKLNSALFFNSSYSEFLSKMPKSEYMKLYVKCHCKHLYKFYRKIKNIK